MSQSAVETLTDALPTLSLRSGAAQDREAKPAEQQQQQQPASQPAAAAAAADPPYRYAHLLPVFSPDHYPPLTPFAHTDPGARALAHADPRAFLAGATAVADLTPHLGTEVHGVSLATLDNVGRDQLALEVRGGCGFFVRGVLMGAVGREEGVDGV